MSWTLRIITDAIAKHPGFDAIHPGQILKLDVMEPSALSAAKLAQAMGVSRSAVNRVVQGNNPASITADFAARLELSVGVSAEFWLGLQNDYDFWRARQKPLHANPALEFRSANQI